MKPNKETKASNATKIIIFGLDEDTKPRAARFVEKDIDAATKAAAQLNLNVWHIATPAPDLITKLPIGNAVASGWNIVPKIKHEEYEAVLAAATLDHPLKKDTVPVIGEQDKIAVRGLKPAEHAEMERQILAVAHERQIGRLPVSWSSIKEGSVVLVHQNREDGWWEGFVLKRQGNMLTLRWRDYPKQPPIVRHVSTVALMDPKTN